MRGVKCKQLQITVDERTRIKEENEVDRARIERKKVERRLWIEAWG
jgi:hypothetical protein